MAPQGGGKRGGGRGRGNGESTPGGNGGGAGRQGGGSGGSAGEGSAPRKGAGRGIPDFKENPAAKRAPDEENGEPAQKFNAQEATDWMAQRFQSVMDEYEKQKQSGKKGDIQNFSELNSERSAWGGGARPVLPPKEDFLHQLQVALAPYRQRSEDQKIRELVAVRQLLCWTSLSGEAKAREACAMDGLPQRMPQTICDALMSAIVQCKGARLRMSAGALY
eukprot:CAMPEP_0177186962 /NCGR_PEP_ID=MMETSP0367-20130122/18935_1 /TAXON_ID=447022 ORGANISM="Scrippsiella hangoei-like, Strain SHHI-4" /NCGR_SAMPLE_ID=MMETSP0367 /ASSEMBLY_ACC=CAM_ASM_000362 /LENGTH=219 /DNA_ID=CAMNT_0018634309 /DNA_START=59 /DNA_END=719 /DNA_ORIENTATION=+